jgi:hypothetical protein
MKLKDSRLLSSVLGLTEPFLELDINALRKQYLTDTLLQQSRTIIRGELGESADERIVNLLAGLMVDVHVLKAAYVERSRYVEPGFEIPMPPTPDAESRSEIIIDLRGDITGGNWWHPEQDGRWAGPENQSSLYMPRLDPGNYALEIHAVDEIEPGIVDSMQVSLDNQVLIAQRDTNGLPCTLTARVELTDELRMPFHVLKLGFDRLRAPAEFGSRDTRRLAVRILLVSLKRV